MAKVNEAVIAAKAVQGARFTAIIQYRLQSLANLDSLVGTNVVLNEGANKDAASLLIGNSKAAGRGVFGVLLNVRSMQLLDSENSNASASQMAREFYYF